MNFSKYKLHNYLTEGQTTERGATASITSSIQGTERSKLGAQNSMEKKQNGSARQRAQSTHKTASLTRMGSTMEHLDQINQEKELIKAYESKKSNWRQELNEKAMDGQERENHPFVTVMPTGDEPLIQAMKQMGKEVKNKKDEVQGQVKEGYEETKKHEVLSALKKKKGDFKKRYGKDAPDVMYAVANKTAKKKGDTSKSDDRYAYEEVELEDGEILEEGKKKCKEGYKRNDEGKCVKKKKKSSSSKRTTIVFGGRYGYGHGHHHDHDDNDNDGGDAGDSGGGDGGGGMGEMFDMLGDMLLQEKSDQMKKMKAEYDEASKQPSPFDKMTPKQKKQMSKATGPRPGSRYRGD